jgi:hypothetical protein
MPRPEFTAEDAEADAEGAEIDLGAKRPDSSAFSALLRVLCGYPDLPVS